MIGPKVTHNFCYTSGRRETLLIYLINEHLYLLFCCVIKNMIKDAGEQPNEEIWEGCQT
jgi:hypothetical protein